MDAIAALLRTAMRIADARAAVVAFDHDATPVAFAGCSLGAASVALREGEGALIACSTAGPAASLMLIGAGEPTDGNVALDAIARELGIAVFAAAPSVDRGLAQLSASVEGLADPVMIARASDAPAGPLAIAYVNASFERLFGFTTADLAGRPDDLLFTAASLETMLHVRERLAGGDPVRSIIVAMRSRNDDALWVDVTARAVRDDRGAAAFYVFTLRDITARRAFESTVAAEKQRLAVTLKAIAEGVITVLPDGRIDFVNAAAQRTLNRTCAQMYGAPLRSVVTLLDDRKERREIPLDPNGDVRGEGVLADGERQLHLAFVSSPILAASGETIGFVIVLRDITAQARLTRRLAYEASHDSLTRLPNRRHFEEIVEVALEAARHRGTQHTVAYIDLDHFKTVNDTLGHQAGDRLLRELAHRMSLNVRGNDVLARIGGDEFGLLLHECAPSNAFRVAEKIRASVESAARDIAGPGASVRASVGIALLDAASVDAASVLDAADRACYHAKAGGRNAVVVAEVIAGGSN
jgi:diguanylate cyclase (GGDEF)-like protein/PAS domain S-box-containing protein